MNCSGREIIPDERDDQGDYIGPIMACLNMAQRVLEADGKTVELTIDTIEGGEHVRLNTDAVSFVIPREHAVRLTGLLLAEVCRER